MTINAKRLIPTILAFALIGAAAGTALADGADEAASAFTRIEGGAVYDYKYAVDGGALAERFTLVHVVCSDGSKSLRVMLPASPEDDGTVFDFNGPDSTLSGQRGSYRVTFEANGQTIRKTLDLKPVNDPKSAYDRQFVVRVDYGDALWTALTGPKGGEAVMLIGQGGKPVFVPADPKLDAALKSCGLTVSNS